MIVQPLFLVLSIITYLGDYPAMVPFQAILTDASGSALETGSYILEFGIYENNESQDMIWGPYTKEADVINGRVNLTIGPNDISNRSIVDAFKDAGRYIEVKVSGQVIAPRFQVLNTPYSLVSHGLVDSSVTTAMIADDAITGEKVLEGTIERKHLAGDARIEFAISNSEGVSTDFSPHRMVTSFSAELESFSSSTTNINEEGSVITFSPGTYFISCKSSVLNSDDFYDDAYHVIGFVNNLNEETIFAIQGEGFPYLPVSIGEITSVFSFSEQISIRVQHWVATMNSGFPSQAPKAKITVIKIQ